MRNEKRQYIIPWPEHNIYILFIFNQVIIDKAVFRIKEGEEIRLEGEEKEITKGKKNILDHRSCLYGYWQHTSARHTAKGHFPNGIAQGLFIFDKFKYSHQRNIKQIRSNSVDSVVEGEMIIIYK